MKFYYLEGLNIHAIGVIYRRHRSQVARRMQDEIDVTISTLLASTRSEPEPPVG